jgi:hypothetical protein
MSRTTERLLNIILISHIVVLPVSATEVDASKLGKFLKVSVSVPLEPEYIRGCIYKGLGASVEYWYVLKSKVCSETVGNAWGLEGKLDRLVAQGNGFTIRTVCTSMGTMANCEGKPKNKPFDFTPVNIYLGRCIRSVQRTNGYSGVFCVKGLPRKQADNLLKTLMDSRGSKPKDAQNNIFSEQD